MPRKFSSFLIRWWRSEDGERLEVQHIQSGRKQLTSSVEDAVIWLSAQQDADDKSTSLRLADGNEAGHTGRDPGCK